MEKSIKEPYEPEYISFSEYLRRKNDMRLKADPMASLLRVDTIAALVETGAIVPYIHPGTTRKLLDWKQYKNFPFVVRKKSHV